MTDLDALREAARAAYVFTLPLIEIATTRSRRGGAETRQPSLH
jgi:hypothetical protein